MNEEKLICGLGHSRSGTGYLSKYLQSLGIDVGHEKMGKDGIVSWMFAIDNASEVPYSIDNSVPNDYQFKYKIHVIRNPYNAIQSVAMGSDSLESWEYRKKFINLNMNLNKYELAIESYIKWNNLILSTSPDLSVQLENCEEIIVDFLRSKNIKLKDGDDSISKKTNTRSYNYLKKSELVDELSDEYIDKLLAFYNNVYVDLKNR